MNRGGVLKCAALLAIMAGTLTMGHAAARTDRCSYRGSGTKLTVVQPNNNAPCGKDVAWQSAASAALANVEVFGKSKWTVASAPYDCTDENSLAAALGGVSGDAVLVVLSNVYSEVATMAAAEKLKRSGVEIFTVTLTSPAFPNVTLQMGDALSSGPVVQRSFAGTLSQSSEGQNVVFATIVNALSKGQGVFGTSCVSFGDPHIATFDGSRYSFQGHGEFYLVKSEAMEVQVRQAACGSESSDIANPQSGALCNRAFAFSADFSGSRHTLSIEYERTSNVLTVLEDGEEVDLFAGTTKAWTTTFTVGGSDDGWTAMIGGPNGAGAYVAFDVTGGLVSVNMPGSAIGKTMGLCGNFNQCPDDDIFNRVNTTTISRNSRLYDDDAAYYPAVLEAGESWRVPVGESLFQTSVNQAYLRTPYYRPLFESKTSSDDAACAGLTGWLKDTCNFDVATYGAGFAWAPQHLMQWNCHEFCKYGASPMTVMDDFSMCRCAAADGLDLHGEYSSKMAPTATVEGKHLSTAFLRVPLGGSYKLRRGLAGHEVDVNVKCNGVVPALSAGANQTVNASFIGGVRVTLSGSAGMDVPSYWRISWKPIAWPMNAMAPALELGATMMPWFHLHPSADAYGTYVFELAVSDGCEIWKSQTTVTFECKACDAAAETQLLFTHPLMQNDVTIGKQIVGSMNISASAKARATVGFQLEKMVKKATDSLPAVVLVPVDNDGNPIAQSPVTVNNPTQKYIIMYDNYTMASNVSSISTADSKSYVDYTEGGQKVNDAPSLKLTVAPYSSLPNVAWPANYAAQFSQNSSDITNTTVFTSKSITKLCDVVLTREEHNGLVNGVVKVTAAGSLTSDDCLEKLNMTYGVINTCTPTNTNLTMTNSTMLTASCGRPPVPRIACPGNSMPKWTKASAAGQFSSVTLDGSNSYSWMNTADAARALTYMWTATSIPPNAAEPDLGSGAAIKTFTPTTKGDYTFELSVADGCQKSQKAASVTFTASCDSKLSVTFGTVSDFTPSGTTKSKTIDTVTTTNEDLATTFVWDVTPPSFPSGFGNDLVPVTMAPTKTSAVLPKYPGTYTLSLRASDNCVTEVKTQELKVTAPGSLGLKAAIKVASSNLLTGETITVSAADSTDSTDFPITTSYWWISKYPSDIIERPALDGGVIEVTGDASTVFPGEKKGSGKNTDVSFKATAPGDYEITLMVYNGITMDTTTKSFTVACRAITADSIELDKSSYESDDPVTASFKTSERIGDARWWVTNDRTKETVKTVSSGASITFTTGTKDKFTITAVVGLSATVCPISTATKDVTPTCPTAQKSFTLTAKEASVAVSWVNNGFGSADLDVTVGGSDKPDDVVVSYMITSAPAGSIYVFNQTATMPNLEEWPFTYPTTVSGLVNTTKVTTRTLGMYPQVTPVYPIVSLTAASDTAACFYPDVAGEYKLMAVASSATSPCYVEPAEFTVTTTCNAAPVPKVTGEMTLQIPAGGSVVTGLLDASGSTDADDDVLTYTWSWPTPVPTPTPSPSPSSSPSPTPSPSVAAMPYSRNNPDAGAYQTYVSTYDLPAAVAAQDIKFILTKSTAQASLVFEMNGTFPIILTVSDGCNVVTKEYTITVTTAATTQSVDFAFNGLGPLAGAHIPVVDKDDKTGISNLLPGKAGSTCRTPAFANWMVVGYTPPTPRSASNSASGSAIAPPAARAAPASTVDRNARVEVINQEEAGKIWSYSAIVGLFFGLVVTILLVVLIVVSKKAAVGAQFDTVNPIPAGGKSNPIGTR